MWGSQTCLSAEHDTPIATGQEAPCRGKRTTLTSWQKYLPPNCAPMPSFLVNSSTCCSSFVSRKPRPCSLPETKCNCVTEVLAIIGQYNLFATSAKNDALCPRMKLSHNHITASAYNIYSTSQERERTHIQQISTDDLNNSFMCTLNQKICNKVIAKDAIKPQQSLH